MRAVSSSTSAAGPKTVAKQKPTAFRRAWGKGFILPVIIILLWQLIGSLELISKTVLPAPYDILLTFRDLIASGEFFTHLGISIQRAAFGFSWEPDSGCCSGLSSDSPK